MVVEVIIEGTNPLLMHSQRGMKLTDPIAMELQSLNSKRGKTLDDRRRISDLEMELGLYYDEELGPYIEYLHVKRCLQDGGKMLKLGTHVNQSLRSVPGYTRFPLIYKGPRKIHELVNDPAFRDTRMVGLNKVMVERTRPIFRQWKLAARFLLDHERLDLHKLGECAKKAGAYIGLLDYRPEYGTFSASVRKVDE